MFQFTQPLLEDCVILEEKIGKAIQLKFSDTEVSMTSSSFTYSDSTTDQANVWNSLKRAISTSSGFQRWKSELSVETLETIPLDQLVRNYLRETLETLAY